MDTQRAAEIQVVLEGVRLPASRAELVRYAARFDEDAARAVARLPDRTYGRLDEVGEALHPTQPRRRVRERLPEPESGLPPGGADYVRARPRSGAVRLTAPPDNPPQKTIEEQSEAQKRQQAVQSG